MAWITAMLTKGLFEPVAIVLATPTVCDVRHTWNVWKASSLHIRLIYYIVMSLRHA